MSTLSAIVLLLATGSCTAFFIPQPKKWSSTNLLSTAEAIPDFNSVPVAVPVAKEGGMGMATASQQALERGLSLGAPPARPPARPQGGHYLTKGGVQVTAHVEPLVFSKDSNDDSAGTTSAGAIEDRRN